MTVMTPDRARESAVRVADPASARPYATFDVVVANDRLVIRMDPDRTPNRVSMKDEAIHIDWPDAESPAVLTFKLAPSLELVAAQLGWLPEDLLTGEAMDLPFQGRYDLEASTLVVTVANDGAYRTYSFNMAALYEGRKLVHDPKIYNDGPPPEGAASH